MPAPPNVANYHIGKGIVSFKETGASSFVDLGNAPSFLYTPKTERKEHFSSRTGVKTKDFTAVTTAGASVKFTLDEITGNNLAMFALATIDATTPGQIILSGLKKTVYTGDLKIVGTNAIGQTVDFVATVSFVPSGDFSFITDGDDFSTIEIEAEVQAGSSGEFGLWTVHDIPYKKVTVAVVASGGTAYAVGNTISLGNGVVLTVATLTSTAVATATITNPGSIPSTATPPTNPVAQVSSNGAGTGATFTLTWAAGF
jgi:hypothetical protein